MIKKAAEIQVFGLVQGVGFRYFCLRLANQLSLNGWVKNKNDGSVVTFAEGESDNVDQYIDQIKEGPPSSMVSEVKISSSEYTGQFSQFEILRS